MINRIDIEKFIACKNDAPIFDVRTPAEFEHAHIPKAINLPIFTNDERAKIGTTYKQIGREEAILLGFEITGPKWRTFIETAKKYVSNKKLYVHCWRGGMRSGAMAWALDFYGFDVTIINGGYKQYRNWVLQQFDNKYLFKVLGGKTGSHKTDILKEIEKLEEQIIDLEGLANHLGSAYGSLNKLIQPSQEYFENLLAEKLYKCNRNKSIWVENESSLIGKVAIPQKIFKQIQDSFLLELEIPKEQRLEFLLEEYGTLDKDFLKQSTLRIQKRLGPLQTQQAIAAIDENRTKDFIEIVLQYYDKTYQFGINNRTKDKYSTLAVNFDTAENVAKKVLNFNKKI